MPRIIVALDYDAREKARALIDQLDPKACALKVGLELFTRCGPAFVRELVDEGFPVFLDLKFHDIPNTVAQACKAAADLGVWMMNIHASGGPAMLAAAREAVNAYGSQRPLLIAVTVLTSMSAETLTELGSSRSLPEQVAYLAGLGFELGLDGVVCSAQEVVSIKHQTSSGFLTVTPGIRLPGDEAHDQHRIMTPAAAIAAGSDYLVIGRSITGAANPLEVLTQINQNIS